MTHTAHATPHGPSHIRRTVAIARRRRKSGPPPRLPLGARLADLVATAVGSWRFIAIQSTLLAAWVTGNALVGAAPGTPSPSSC